MVAQVGHVCPATIRWRKSRFGHAAARGYRWSSPPGVRGGGDAAAARRLDFSRDRRVSVERQVRSRSLVGGAVRDQDSQEAGFVEHDYVVQTLAPDRADEALHIRRLPERPVRDDNFFDAQTRVAPAEVLAVDAVMVADQEARRLVKGEGFHDLLRRPARGGVRRHAEVHQRPAVVTQHQEAADQAETYRGDDQEIDRDDVGQSARRAESPRGVDRSPSRAGRPSGTSASPTQKMRSRFRSLGRFIDTR